MVFAALLAARGDAVSSIMIKLTPVAIHAEPDGDGNYEIIAHVVVDSQQSARALGLYLYREIEIDLPIREAKALLRALPAKVPDDSTS